ncbi:helix-turn-helix domain-containing protein [Haploplasma axanthum]|uniref:Helix-turn-helix domain n=1 Tax=Haploplasma axanthum TaxID=29552 RepID=A0A449BD43_HAPAX|nr:helix-turn-helix transcriptional regulator [Haploplasma axanthum]VEU80356.1 Helix-turn-helix domain [Haploplasma axanthum]
MNLTRIRKIINEYQNMLDQKDRTIGSIIKHYRKERNYTLDDTSNGICSISYLCKVEKNQLIPSDIILPKLIKRLKINEEEINTNKKSDWVKEVLKDYNILKKMYNSVFYLKDYQSKLIKYTYNLLIKNDMIAAHKEYIDLTEYYTYFTEEEMCFYLYLIMINYYKKEQYSEIINMYKDVLIFNEQRELQLKIKVIVLKSFYKCERYSEANIMYEKVISDLLNYNMFEEIIKLRSYDLAAKAKELETEVLIEHLNLLNNTEKMSFEYIWFVHYFYKKNDYEKAVELILKIKDLNAHYYIMCLIALDITKKGHEIVKILSSKPNFDMPNSYKVIINYLKKKYSNERLFSFIKEEIVIAKFLTDEAIIIDYLFNEACELYKSEHYYKGTVSLLEKHNRFLKQRNKNVI